MEKRPGRAGPLLDERPAGAGKGSRRGEPGGLRDKKIPVKTAKHPRLHGEGGRSGRLSQSLKRIGRASLFVLIDGRHGVDLGLALPIKVRAPLFRGRTVNDDLGRPLPRGKPRGRGFGVVGAAARLRPTVDEAVLVFFRKFQRVDRDGDFGLADPVEKEAEKLAPAEAARIVRLMRMDYGTMRLFRTRNRPCHCQ